MILIAALNPALDITYHVPGVDWSGENRPACVSTRPGGKGLNVARTLRALGADVHVLGLAGGATGTAVASALTGLGVPAMFTQAQGETRRTLAVVDTRSGETALFNEPGPRVAAHEYAQFLTGFQQAVRDCAAVVLSGSLPPGLPAGTYAELAAVAAAAGAPVLLDAHGEALVRGTAARPAVVKPNLAELAGLAGRPLSTPDGPDRPAVAAAAGKLRAAGAGAVVVSLGPHGLWALTGEGCWQAAPPGAVAGNPTGAGDAVTAALVHGLVLGRRWDERLRHAVALGTAAAAAPVAGEFSQDDYRRLLPAVSVRPDGAR